MILPTPQIANDGKRIKRIRRRINGRGGRGKWLRVNGSPFTTMPKDPRWNLMGIVPQSSNAKTTGSNKSVDYKYDASSAFTLLNDWPRSASSSAV
jgi:hypothetical protein